MVTLARDVFVYQIGKRKYSSSGISSLCGDKYFHTGGQKKKKKRKLIEDHKDSIVTIT